MANLAAGGTDWVDNTIQRLRFNFANALDAVFDVDWIAVGRVGPGASSKAVQSLSSDVTQQGSTLTSQAQALLALTNRVTDTEGVNSAQASAISQIDTTVQQQGTAPAGVIDWSQVITAEAKAQAQQELLLAGVTAEVAQRRAAADQAIAPLQDAVDLEEATEAETDQLKLWKRYRVALSRLHEQEGYPTEIDWPAPPA
ncbi:tail fiber assembly protein [Pseudomonas putida]|nr:tail fiber assembly protein [Pseudomonas putida]